MVGDGWLPWDGNPMDGPPLTEGSTIQVRFRNGRYETGPRDDTWDWEHVNDGFDIVAYRVVDGR